MWCTYANIAILGPFFLLSFTFLRKQDARKKGIIFLEISSTNPFILKLFAPNNLFNLPMDIFEAEV